MSRDQRPGRLVLREAAGAFAIASVGLAAGVGVEVLLARLLGVTGYGVYAYVLSIVSVLIVLGRAGMDPVLLRFVASYRAAEDWGRVRGVVRGATGAALVVCLPVGGLLLLGTWWGAPDPALAAALWLGPLLLVGRVLFDLAASALRALRRVPLAVAARWLLLPGALAALVAGVALWAPARLDGATAIALHGVGALLVAALMGLAIRASMPGAAADYGERRAWLAVAGPVLVLSIFHELHSRADILMIGALLGHDQAGIYAAAQRLAVLPSWGLMAVNMILPPVVAHAWSLGDRDGLREALRSGARVNAVCALPVAVGLALAGPWLLDLWGDEYRAGHAALVLLAAGSCANALAGSVGYLLTMTGQQRFAAVTMALAAVVNLILDALLIPRWGLVGGAAATGASTALWNAIMWVRVRRHLGCDPSVLGLLRVSSRP